MQAGSQGFWLVSRLALASCLAIATMSSAAHAQDQQQQKQQQAPLPIDIEEPGVTLPGALEGAVVTEDIAAQEEELEETPQATQAAANPDDQIVVRGLNERQSSWKRAETDHLIIYSNGSESGLRKAAIDVERLHYLISRIFGRLDAQDDTQKLRVMLIGNAEFMESMRLVNWRSAEGPYTGPVQNQRYYDPRIDGAVLAVTRSDLYFSAASGATQGGFNTFFAGPADFTAADSGEDDFGDSGFNDDPGPPDFVDDSGGDQERPWEQALFAGYAQHYITTHLPAAYPRWYIDAIGALFSTFRVNDKGNIEYGRQPPAFRGLYNNSKDVDIAQLLTTGSAQPDSVWSSHQAWLLAHFFFLSSDNQARKTQLAQYMGAIAKGHTPQAAASVFGDLEKLQKEIERYGNGRSRFAAVPLEDLAPIDPDIRSLGVTEAALLEEQLQLDARLILPPLPTFDTPPDDAEAMRKAYARSLALRDGWLAELRKDVAALSFSADGLLLLAEAECRIGNFAECIAAADRVIAEIPNDNRAISWKAIALVNQAVSGPQEQRQERVRAARSLVLAANRANPDALLPLVAYFRSFTDNGEAAPEAAMLAMLKVIQTVPNAPEPRLLLSQELVRQARTDAAQAVLLPLVKGPWDSPERQQALLLQ